MVTADRINIRRLRQAMHRLQQARNYQQQAARMVKDAETELKSAIAASMQPVQPDGDDGERRIA